MKDSIDRLFGKPAFMPYVCCGDPDGEGTVAMVNALAENGADAIELGIPFSDPMADGRAIQGASRRALEAGMTPAGALAILSRLRKGGLRIPVFIMTYYNIVYSNGVEKFTGLAAESGADGFIIPDLPPEEAGEMEAACRKSGLALVRFITPNCDKERLKRISKGASGFLYAVSAYGTTGARDGVSEDALRLIGRAGDEGSLPIVIGFGISGPEQAKAYVKAGASGVIVGSRLVELRREGGLEAVADFSRAIASAISAGARERI